MFMFVKGFLNLVVANFPLPNPPENFPENVQKPAEKTKNNSPKLPQHMPKTFPKPFPKRSKSPPNPPKSSRNLFKPLPKSTQNPSRSSLGAHLGPMLERSSILNVHKMAKRWPKAPERGPRPAQTFPKWSPRPSQN